MGEYADMAIDEMLSIDEAVLQGRYGDDDDPYFSPFSGRWKGFGPRRITCKNCGETGLRWIVVDDQWKLGDWKTYAHHKCSFGFKNFIGTKS